MLFSQTYINRKKVSTEIYKYCGSVCMAFFDLCISVLFISYSEDAFFWLSRITQILHFPIHYFKNIGRVSFGFTLSLLSKGKLIIVFTKTTLRSHVESVLIIRKICSL